MKPVRKSVIKLRKLKEIRRKNLEKNFLEIQMKGQDHYIFINERGKAQVVTNEGNWVSEHIRTAVLKYNYEIDKIEKLFIKDFTDEEINEYEKTLQ
jgi:L-lactate utilization protein LutB